MKYPVSFWGKLAAAVCVFIALKVLISYVALSSFAAIKIDAEFDHDDVIDIYYSSGINGSGFTSEHTIRSEEYAKDTRAVKLVRLNDNVDRKIRIDIGLEPGTLKLFSFTLTSYYGPDITFLKFPRN